MINLTLIIQISNPPMNCDICFATALKEYPVCCESTMKCICTECLYKIYVGDQTLCPFCKSTHQLPINQGSCSNCKKITMTYCEGCSIHLCEGCWKLTHIFVPLSNHILLEKSMDKPQLQSLATINTVKNQIQEDLDKLDLDYPTKTLTNYQKIVSEVKSIYGDAYNKLYEQEKGVLHYIEMITENEKAILKDVYNEYEGTRELIVSDIATGNTSSPSIKNYQTRSIDYNLKMNDIKFPIWVSLPGPLSGTYTLFTIDNEYRAPRDLVCTLILVGGGSAGGKGGTCYKRRRRFRLCNNLKEIIS